MRIHDNVYQALPVIYVTCGALIFLGSAYVGIGDGLMPVFAALGLICMISGLLVAGRGRPRSGPRALPRDLARTD